MSGSQRRYADDVWRAFLWPGCAKASEMIFYDKQVQALDLTTPAGMQELIDVHLCGHIHVSELSASDQELLREFMEKAVPAGVTFQQFNELLLVLNQDRVSVAFFTFFFGEPTNQFSMGQLQHGVIRFKGYSLVCFGNFRFAFRKLSDIPSMDSLLLELGSCCRKPEQITSTYDSRTEKVLDVSLIGRDQTWFVGEITGRIVADELGPVFS